MAVDILYQSNSFIVVNKPYDMYINSDDENEKNTVACRIGTHDCHMSSSTRPLHFVQRLDYSTSGVLCIAKDKRSAALACKLFEQRLTRKYYLAVLRYHVTFELADVKYDIGTDQSPNNGHKMAVVTGASSACGQPRAAHTRILLLETGFYNDEPVTLVMMKPITGRRHQLRVHCHATGHTILGDYTYSNRTDTTPYRMFLHAFRLVLPVEDEPLDIRTEEPFFSDTRFSNSWRGAERHMSFEAAYDTIDRIATDGLNYSLFTKTE